MNFALLQLTSQKLTKGHDSLASTLPGQPVRSNDAYLPQPPGDGLSTSGRVVWMRLIKTELAGTRKQLLNDKRGLKFLALPARDLPRYPGAGLGIEGYLLRTGTILDGVDWMQNLFEEPNSLRGY